jgi:hypothetical protein
MQNQKNVNKLSGLCTVSLVFEIYFNSEFPKLLSCEIQWEQNEVFRKCTANGMRSCMDS